MERAPISVDIKSSGGVYLETVVKVVKAIAESQESEREARTIFDAKSAHIPDGVEPTTYPPNHIQNMIIRLEAKKAQRENIGRWIDHTYRA